MPKSMVMVVVVIVRLRPRHMVGRERRQMATRTVETIRVVGVRSRRVVMNTHMFALNLVCGIS